MLICWEKPHRSFKDDISAGGRGSGGLDRQATGAGAFSFALRAEGWEAGEAFQDTSAHSAASAGAGIVPWQVLTGDAAADDEMRCTIFRPSVVLHIYCSEVQ